MSRKIGPNPRAAVLLRGIAEDHKDVADWPRDVILRLIEAGIGPVLWRIARDTSPFMLTELQSADLTARLIIGRLLESAREILQAAGDAAAEIIVLKGVVASECHYPEPHLRVMGDIDLLAPPNLYQPLQSLLYGLGYRQHSQLPQEFFTNHHHAMPFYHPTKHQWVEIHSSLFPPSSPCAREACFAPAAVTTESIAFGFRGITTRRLRDELHLIYVCSHWGKTLNLQRGLIPILDVLYLLQSTANLDWDRVRRSAGNGLSKKYLTLLLGYLLAHELIRLESEVIEWVRQSTRRIGRFNVRLLHTLIDNFLVLQRPCGRVLTETNISAVWDTLLRDKASASNLLGIPLALLFPPTRADRFRSALVARRMRSMLRRG